MDQKAMQFFAQLYKAEFRTDGSIRLTLECGADASEMVLDMLRYKSAGRDGFAFACAPYSDKPGGDWTVDPETGEIVSSPSE